MQYTSTEPGWFCFGHACPYMTYGVAAGRYHLYISWACPWANRCAATMYLKACAKPLLVADASSRALCMHMCLSWTKGTRLFHLKACMANTSLRLFLVQGLEDVIGLSVTHPTWQRTKPDDPNDEHTGWTFASPDDPPFTSSTGTSYKLS